MTQPTMALPTELTIYAVAECLQAWRGWLDGGDDAPEMLEVDAFPVQQCDSAGVQLLLSLAAALNARQRGLRLRAPSTPLQQACEQLGLTAWLDALTAQEVAA